MSPATATDIAEHLLQGVHITCDSLEIIKKNEHGDDISVSLHEGTIRDTYPHFMNMLGGLMLEPAVKAGFRLPVSRFQLGDVSQYAEHLTKQADTGYIVKVKNLKMTVPQIEAAKDVGSNAFKAGVDLTAAMWGGSANPWATGWADMTKNMIDTHQETFDASRTIEEGEYDLGEFAAEMAQWANAVNQWLGLMGALNSGVSRS